jgi:hypothetical protein
MKRGGTPSASGGSALRVVAAATAILLTSVPSGFAGVPCLVDAFGVPLRWPLGLAVFNPDPGPLALGPGLAIDRDEALDLLRAAAAVWEGVESAEVQLVAGAPIPSDVGPGNSAEFVGRCGDGMSPVVFDPTGEIIEAAMGEGAAETILGFTIHDCATESAAALTEATVVLNGAAFRRFGADEARRAFLGVIVHELGHFLNLCHSPLNGDVADDGDPVNDVYLPVMFPFRSDDAPGSEPALRLDDVAMLSMLYPAPSFYATSGTIAGHILSGEAGRPVSGVSITVRSTSEPLALAQWTASGWVRLEPSHGQLVESSEVIPAIHGSYQASGLPPGAYTIEVGGEGSGGVREFYSGPTEGPDPGTDSPNAAQAVEVGAGETNPNVTVSLDRRFRSRLGETAWSIGWRGRATIAGVKAALDPTILPRGTLELLSTGRYRMTPATELNGSWRPVGERRYRLELEPGALQALLDPQGQILRIRSVKGRGRVGRRLSTIAGRIRARGTLELPRARLTLRLDYAGERVGTEPPLGRIPIIPSDEPAGLEVGG